jgi:flagellar assembly protein FliH
VKMSTWSESVDVSSLGVQLFSYPTADGDGMHGQRSSGPELNLAIEAAREDGKRAGAAAVRESLEEELRMERQALRQAIEAFAREREQYSRRAEPEVVRLALAIAKKILRREAHVDPILLAGVVRSALQRVDSSMNVRMRVSPRTIQKWKGSFQKECESGLSIVPDPGFADDQCRVESEVGTTELSLTGALKEIDERFMELLTQREVEVSEPQ